MGVMKGVENGSEEGGHVAVELPQFVCRSFISPTQPNGIVKASSQKGLKPLFFTTPVRHVTVQAVEDVAAFKLGLAGCGDSDNVPGVLQHRTKLLNVRRSHSQSSIGFQLILLEMSEALPSVASH